MTGPYLAVILDSFRAAFASRILWVAFLAIWVLLAALAPIGYREDYTTTFRWRDFENATQMKHLLGAALVDSDQADTAVGRLARQLPEDLQRPLRRVGQGEDVRVALSDFADALNQLLDDESWYDAEAWSDTLRLRELRELDEAEAGVLSDSLRRRRARLRIEAALPGVFRSRASRSILFTYAGYEFPVNVAVDKTQFVSLINQWVMPTLINWLLGFVLVFLGILVTASIVPDMLQPGSLHLMLSKPISRPLLLLSKFLGGCAFVFLCVTQLVIGLWLISGFRLDIWNPRLLWCIPVSVFLFSVFYSVSVVAGLRWRSPILAIGITCIFGAVCLVVGFIGGLFDGLVTRPESLRAIAAAEPGLVAATRGGGLVRYDAAERSWKELIESNAMGRDRVLPPIALGDDLVLTANVEGGRFNPYGSGSIDLLVIPDQAGAAPQPSVRLPPATTRLYSCGPDHVLAAHTGGLVISSRQRILRPLTPDREPGGEPEQAEPEASDAQTDSATSAWSGWVAAWMGGRRGEDDSAFVSVLPERMAIVSPSSVAPALDGESILIFTAGRLVRLERPDEKVLSRWDRAAARVVEGEPSRSVTLARSGPLAMLARGEEPLRFFDAATLQPLGTLDSPARVAPIDAIGIGETGRFLVLFSDGTARPVVGPDRGAGPRLMGRLPLRDIETIQYDPLAGNVLVAHHVDRVDVLDPETWTISEQVRPSLESWRFVDQYVITPLRAVIPQTGELGQTVTAIISGKSAVAVDQAPGDGEELVRYEILRPVLSCGGFIAVMLIIGCVYFSRRDF